MKKKKKVEFSYFKKDGRIVTIWGKVLGRSKKNLIFYCFKKIVWSLTQNEYDQVSFLKGKGKISWGKIFNLRKVKWIKFDPKIHARDDGC